MNREQRIVNARQTLEIIEKGFYVVNGHRVNIADNITRSVQQTVLYSPEALINMLEKKDKQTVNQRTLIKVTNQSVLEALSEITVEGSAGCLNFASATNPGGGFQNGALAQEETLAAASSLYPSLLKCFEMYKFNRSNQTNLYSDHMIYSPDVLFFKDDDGNLLNKPYMADILTCPAVNVSAVKQNNPAELIYVEQTMMSRMDKMLFVFASHNVENLVLGAWGCGVFQNSPFDIARYFAEFLTGNGKYAGCFRKIIFAVFDRSEKQENIKAFRKHLEN